MPVIRKLTRATLIAVAAVAGAYLAIVIAVNHGETGIASGPDGAGA